MSFRQPKGSTIGIIKTGATVQQKFDSLDQSIIDLTNIVNQINKGGGGENVGTPWLYSATGGETSFTVTSSATIASISCIFINGTRQEPTINFTYDAPTKKISLVGFSLVAGDQVVVILLDGTSPTLTKLAANTGAGLVGTTNGKTVQSNLSNILRDRSPRISDYGISSGSDATTSFTQAATDAQSSTGVIVVDINCILDTFTIPANITVVIQDHVTVTHKTNASSDMFIASEGSQLISEKVGGKLRGNSSQQTVARMCFKAIGVKNAGVSNLDIRDFKSYGAYFSGCEDTYCTNNTIRDITGGKVETAAGQYITNCKRHESKFNDIRDTGSNGIKFRADALGGTVGCRSIGDKVYRAGFIGIANGKCQDHIVQDAYCEECVDNGVDMNGCDNTRFISCTSVKCQDGFYIGENGINNCHIISCSARSCKRSGIGSLGSLTRCSVSDTSIDSCGSGIYCSGFVGFKFDNLSIYNSVKQTYTDNETGTQKTSTGIGIDIQSNLSNCYFVTINNVFFFGNSGYDIAFGSSGTIGSLQLKLCTFMDSAGDGKISYGGAVLDTPYISGNVGYLTETTKEYTITGDGINKTFILQLPSTVKDTSYKISSITVDLVSSIRWVQGSKTTTQFAVEYGTAPAAGNRIVTVRLEGLKP